MNWLERPLLALSVIRGAATFCPLLDKSGQRWISARDGLSSFDPKRTLRLIKRLTQLCGVSPSPPGRKVLSF